MDERRLRVGSSLELCKIAVKRTKQFAGRTILQIALASSVIVGPTPALAQELSAAAGGLLASIRALQDNKGLPYIIVDKLDARIFVFNERGAMVATTAALLGLARGDHSVPGIGDRPLSAIKPVERTTPSGRFVAATGRNDTGEHVLWIDYDAALSLHRLRNDARDRLTQRLMTPTPTDNRTSYGCVTVPVQFYEKVIRSTFAGGRGIVYILPETKPWTEAITFDAPTPALIRVSNSETQ